MAERSAEWVKKNPLRSREIKRDWDRKNPEKAASARAAYQSDKEARRAQKAEYRDKNRSAVQRQQAEWYARNREKVRDRMRAYHSEWSAANPHRRAEQRMKRRALEKSATPEDFGDFDRFVLEEAYLACKRRESLHGVPFHVDHMTPLARGGKHAYYNIQVIPAALNMWKGDKLVLTRVGEWVHAL